MKIKQIAKKWFKAKKFKKVLTEKDVINAYVEGFLEANDLMGRIITKVSFPEAQYRMLCKQLSVEAFRKMNGIKGTVLGVEFKADFYQPENTIAFYSGPDVIAVINLDKKIEKKVKNL